MATYQQSFPTLITGTLNINYSGNGVNATTLYTVPQNRVALIECYNITSTNTTHPYVMALTTQTGFFNETIGIYATGLGGFLNLLSSWVSDGRTIKRCQKSANSNRLVEHPLAPTDILERLGGTGNLQGLGDGFLKLSGIFNSGEIARVVSQGNSVGNKTLVVPYRVWLFGG